MVKTWYTGHPCHIGNPNMLDKKNPTMDGHPPRWHTQEPTSLHLHLLLSAVYISILSIIQYNYKFAILPFVSTAWVLYNNSLYKNLKGSNPRRATYFQLYQTQSTLRI